MKILSLLRLPALLLTSMAFPAIAQTDTPPPGDARPEAEAAAEEKPAASALPRALASDEKAVRALLGKKAVITGKVTKTFEAANGITLINLEGGKFTAVVGKEKYEKFKGGSPALLYKNKNVEITGEVFEYKDNRAKGKNGAGKLEIRLYGPDQVKIMSKAETSEETQEAGKTDGDSGVEAPADQPEPAENKPEKSLEKAGKTEAGAAKADKSGGTKERVDPKKFFR